MRRQRHHPPITLAFSHLPCHLYSAPSSRWLVSHRRPKPLSIASPASIFPYMVAQGTAEEDVATTLVRPPVARNDTPLMTTHRPPDNAESQDESPAQTPHGGPDGRLIFAGAALVLVLLGGTVAAATGALSPDGFVKLAAWFETLGPNAVYLYAGLYFVLELVGVPAMPLTLGSGYLFGVGLGTVAVSISSTLAAAASFLIARYGLRNSVARIAARYPRFRAMDRAIGRQGFKFVLLLRLSPLLPFAISNYLYGLTSVDLLPYVLGSWLGMLPGTIAYVSAGAAVQALTDLSSGKSNVSPVLVVIGVVATLVALTTIGKMAAEAIEGEDEEVVQN